MAVSVFFFSDDDRRPPQPLRIAEERIIDRCLDDDLVARLRKSKINLAKGRYDTRRIFHPLPGDIETMLLFFPTDDV